VCAVDEVLAEVRASKTGNNNPSVRSFVVHGEASWRFSLVAVAGLNFLQCFSTVDWMISARRHPCHRSANVLFRSKCGKNTAVDLADPASPGNGRSIADGEMMIIFIHWNDKKPVANNAGCSIIIVAFRMNGENCKWRRCAAWGVKAGMVHYIWRES